MTHPFERVSTNVCGAWETHSPAETFQLGFNIGQSLADPMIFLLQGELGTGKTVFAKGLVCGLGHSDPNDVTSPSFTLINEYDMRMKVYHLDLYRLETAKEIATLELEEVFSNQAVVIVEWAERLQWRNIENATAVTFFDLGNDDRKIEIRPFRSGFEATGEETTPNP